VFVSRAPGILSSTAKEALGLSVTSADMKPILRTLDSHPTFAMLLPL